MKNYIQIHSIIIGLLLNLSMYLPSMASDRSLKRGEVYPADHSTEFHSGKSAYIVASPESDLEKRVLDRLSVYMRDVLKAPVRIVSQVSQVPQSSPAIQLSLVKKLSGIKLSSQSPEAFALLSQTINSRKVITATGNTALGLKQAVQRLIIKSEQRAPGLVVPELNISESPWIAQREWALCPWSPDRVRRSFVNPAADKRNDVWLYGDEQISDYVDMYDSFGFNGAQLMETSANYAAMGSPEAFQDKQLKFAKAIRKNGQNVTYWVWAARFDDYGWIDHSVTYVPEKGKTAFEDPKVRATFEKYYNGYAKMAPYTDMVMAHFYDPGELTSREDVFSYLGLLQQKFKAKNPDIKMAVDFWAAGSPSAYMEQLIAHGFDKALLLEMSMPILHKEGEREKLHESAKKLNLQLGMWGWYTTEYETDQRPMMHVNAKAMKNFYLQMKNGVHKIHPFTYWSEMEAYHLNNIFTMYASGQLLWNPDRDTDEILTEISHGIWGPKNGSQVLKALKLIEDMRSGPTWNTFWWGSKEYRLGSPDPDDDIKRAETAIAAFEKIKTDSDYVNKFPLPFEPSVFIELTLPHLRQIKQYAKFRSEIEKVKEAAKNNATRDQLSKMLTDAYQPVLEYNTWVGVWGQAELIEQQKTLDKLAKEYGVEYQTPGWLRLLDANRYLQRAQTIQRTRATPFVFKSNEGIIKAELFWPDPKAADRVKLLVEIGAIRALENGTYQLANWAEFKKQP